jgi:uncharacterized protein (TIGR02246 family)
MGLSTETEDRAQIERLLSTMSDAWNAGDADAFGSVFTDGASYVNLMGMVSRGRAEIVESHRQLFEHVLKGSRMTDGGKTHREITFLTADVALVVGTGGGTALAGQEFSPDRESTVSFVALRGEDGWGFAHFQNTRHVPMPARPN